MEYYRSLDFLLNNLLNHSSQKTNFENTGDDKPGSLEEHLEGKVRCLTKILDEIEQEVQKRNALSQSLIQQIYEHYCVLKSKLLPL